MNFKIIFKIIIITIIILIFCLSLTREKNNLFLKAKNFISQIVSC